MNIKPKVGETETTLREFPCKTTGDPSQNNLDIEISFKRDVVQTDKIKTLEIKLQFFYSHSLLSTDGNVQ